MPIPAVTHTATATGSPLMGASQWNAGHDMAAMETWLHSTFPQTSVYFDYVSTSVCQLLPVGGGMIWINGVNRAVDSGTVLAPTGLTAGTLYNVFAYWDTAANSGAGGTRLVADTTGAGYTAHAATGIPQMTGNAARTLVGRVFMNTGPAFYRGDGARDWVSSYWNRRRKYGVATVVGGSGAPTSLGAVTPIAQAISWGDRIFHAECTTVINCAAGGVLFGAVLLSGVGEQGTTGYFNGAASAFGNAGGFFSWLPPNGEIVGVYGGVRAQGQTFSWYSGQVHLQYEG